MSQPLLTESPDKTQQRIARREPHPASIRSFQGLNPILQLQRTLGNQRVAQLIKAKRLTPDGKIIGLQPKLTVGAADDQYEQEADRVARQVVSMPDSVAMASLQQAPPIEGDARQTHTQTLQSKPLALAASITPFVQRQMGGEEELEKDKNKEEDKDKLLQAKVFNKSAALPLQRQLASEEEKTEPVQAKLSIHRDISPAEEDKDQVLQTKLLATSSPPVVQRQTQSDEESEDKTAAIQAKFLTETYSNPMQRQSATEEEEPETIQTKSAGSLADSFEASDNVESRLSQSKGQGSVLSDPVRSYMEPRFGVDFSHVRVHTGSDAIQMNRDVGAQAFTHGPDIYYGAGSSPTNLELTAHELTHVVQQTGGLPLQPKRLDEAVPNHAACGTNIREQPRDNAISSVGMQVLARLKTTEMAPELPQPKTAPEKSEAAAAGSPAKPAANQAQGGVQAPSVNAPIKPVATHSEKSKAGSSSGKETGGAEVKGGAAEDTAPSPRQAIGPAVAAVRNRATKARKHSTPDVPVASSQAAAKEPKTEQTRDAAEQTVINLNNVADQTKNVEREDFRQKLKDAIHQATPQPKTEEEAEEVMESGATKARSAMHGHMDEERDAAAGPLKNTASTEVSPSNIEAPPQTTLRPEPVGSAPAPVSASPVVPADLPPERLDYSADREPADKLMAENNISKEQLKKGNEPAFDATLTARSGAEKHEATAKVRYRESEAGIQDKAHGVAKATLANDLLGMHGDREQQIGKVVGKQNETKSKNALERQRITDTIKGIKEKTKADVDAILESMESGAETIFETGLAKAEKAYSETFEEEKGGVWTWATTWGEDWEELIEGSLDKARIKYLQQVDVAIDKVADHVDAKLAAAKKRVAAGRKEVENFVNGLHKSVARFGEEALQAVSADFDTMEAGIDERRDKLIDKLTDQYKASSERMSAMEERLREENKSLWQRVYDATVGLVKKILAFKDMLLGILAKAAGVISDIIDDPIGFLGNLISGIAQGLENFMARIGAHLKKGLMDWLFGALGGAGLQLPETLDLKGIISIVLQVLGLTYANFRARAAAKVGEGAVGVLEEKAEVFKVLVTEGISGLWRFIKEKVGDLKTMVLDAIFDFIKDSVIIAGIKWIIGLLNPASAFFKACMAIYDIVMFFINRGSQIIDLVNAIVDSIASIAKGAVGTAVGLVEGALAKAIPVTIGFLAGLLGLGDISGTVRKTIDKAKSPVDKAVDWVIDMTVKGLKKVGGALGFGKKDKDRKNKDEVPEETNPEKSAKIELGLTAINDEEKKFIIDGEISRENAEKVAASVKAAHSVFRRLLIIGTEHDNWIYEFEASPAKKHSGRAKAISLPSLSSLTINMAHIVNEHTIKGGGVGGQDLFPLGMNERQIENVIRKAYKIAKKTATQPDGIRVEGIADGLTIEMWIGLSDKKMRSAYPLGGLRLDEAQQQRLRALRRETRFTEMSNEEVYEALR